MAEKTKVLVARATGELATALKQAASDESADAPQMQSGDVKMNALKLSARDFSVAEKADRSPLTEADTRAHAAIHATLSARTPEIPILSEEGADVAVAVRQSWGRYWLVDPLEPHQRLRREFCRFQASVWYVAQRLMNVAKRISPVASNESSSMPR